MTFLGGKISNNSYDLFFSHRPGFSDFYSLFSDSPYLCCVKCRIYPFFTRKSTIYLRKEFLDDTYCFYSVRPFAPIPQHYFSKYWGDQCMGRPPTSNFSGGGPSPQSRLGLRP